MIWLWKFPYFKHKNRINVFQNIFFFCVDLFSYVKVLKLIVLWLNYKIIVARIITMNIVKMTRFAFSVIICIYHSYMKIESKTINLQYICPFFDLTWIKLCLFSFISMVYILGYSTLEFFILFARDDIINILIINYI